MAKSEEKISKKRKSLGGDDAAAAVEETEVRPPCPALGELTASLASSGP
jgi:hypothetical protein